MDAMSFDGTCTAPLALSAAALSTMIVWVAALVAGHLQNNGLSALRNAVSEFGAVPRSGPYIAVAWWSAAAIGALMCASFAVLLPLDGSAWTPHERAGVFFLGLYAPARLLTWYFPSAVRWPRQPPGSTSTTNDGAIAGRDPVVPATAPPTPVPTHKWHVLFAVISFASISIAAPILAKAMYDHPAYTGFYNSLSGFYGVALWIPISLGVSFVLRRCNVFGLTERIFYAAQITWFFFAASATIITCNH